MAADWNARARDLLQLGLSVKQISRIRDESALREEPWYRVIARDDKDKSVVDPKYDVFLAPYSWVRESHWEGPEDPTVDWSTASFAPCHPGFDKFHAEDSSLRELLHDDVEWNVEVIKLNWLGSGALVRPRRFIAKGDDIVRDWCGSSCPLGTKKRSAMLVALGVRFRDEGQRKYHEQVVATIQKTSVLQGDDVRFELDSVREWQENGPLLISSTSPPSSVTVFSDDPIMERYLKSSKASKDKRFIFTDDKHNAACWYTLSQVKFGQNGTIPPALRGVNQFPFEAALVRKDICLVQVLRACANNLASSRDWILPAFDLETELAMFLDEFKRHDGTCWVVKPAQRARSAGIVVSSDLKVIVSAMNAFGNDDKVAQKYVDRPLLLRDRRKFDLRTIVLVERFGFGSKLIAWANVKATYARIARSDFTMDNFTLKQAHLTVSRYDNSNPLAINEFPLTCDLAEIRALMGDDKWTSEIESKAWKMMRQVLEAASHWIAPSQSRFPQCHGACYGIDWMVNADRFPKLIEVNFGPDLTVASELCDSLEESILTVLAGMKATAAGSSELSKDWIRL